MDSLPSVLSDTKADTAARQHSVLVVDDDHGIGELIQTVLERDGFRVVFAEGGCPALERMQSERFDLIITDILMPDCDGFELLIRACKLKSDHPPLIVMSGGGILNPEYLLNTARTMGAAEVLEKPFDLAELRAAVHRVLGDLERKE